MNKESILSNIPVVIMAGGKGTRMKNISTCVPKPLLEYKGRTQIENIIDMFRHKGVNTFYLVLYHKHELIEAYFKAINLPVDIRFIVEETAGGTAGGLRLLDGLIEENFIVCNCDDLGDFDYREIVERHITEGNQITIAVKRIKKEMPFGLVIEESGRFEKILEKPEYELTVSTGIHVMNATVLKKIPICEKLDMPDLLNLLVNNVKIECFDIGGQKWIDMSVID